MKKNKETIIFDMNGIIYSFSKNFNSKENNNNFDNYIQNNSNIKDISPKEELELEFLGISNFFENKENQLKIYKIQKGIDLLEKFYKEEKNILIVSTSKVETSKLILKHYLTNYDILENIKIYNMLDFGSKKEIKAWQEIFEKYENITKIYEDGEKNLEAAKKASQNLGFNSQCYLEP